MAAESDTEGEAPARDLEGGTEGTLLLADGLSDPDHHHVDAPLSNSAQWKKRLQQHWALKVTKLSGGTDPLMHDIGTEGDKRLVYTYLGLHKTVYPTEKFLASMDGAPGRVSTPGTLGTVISAVWLVSVVFLAMGLWRLGDCQRNPYFKAFPCIFDDSSFHFWCAVLAPLMTLPGYICEILTMELSLVRVIATQYATIKICAETLVGCIFLTLLLWDERVCIVWISIFLGVIELTFSDALAVDAATTKSKQKWMVVVGALPFLAMLYHGLSLNQKIQKTNAAESEFNMRLPLYYGDIEQTDETTQGWNDWLQDHNNYLTWCRGCFQSIISHLLLFLLVAASNRYNGRKRSAMLKVGLELHEAEKVNVHKLWQSVLEASKEDKTKLEVVLEDLQRQAHAAAAAHAGQAGKA